MLSLNKHPQRLHNHTCDQKASLIISMGPLGFRGFRNRGRTATFIMSIPGYLSWAADALVCVQSSPARSVAMPCSSLLIVMATLLIGTSTVRDCRHRGDSKSCREYEGDDFHSTHPVIIILGLSI
jgi:hypothetical protein